MITLRIIEDLFKIDHVTISRIIIRIISHISKIKVNDNDYYIVDITFLRIGKGKNKETYSGYKYHDGIKFQIVINNKSIIEDVSQSYNSSIHDKRLFITDYKDLMSR